MRILIASDTYYPMANGASYFTQRLAAGMAARGHEVYAMAPGRAMRNVVITRDNVYTYEMRSVPVPVYKDFRLTPPLLVKSSIGKALDEIKPDIVHIQSHFMLVKALAEAAKARGIPVVGTSHFMPENLVHYFHLPTVLERQVILQAWKQFARVYRDLDGVMTPTSTAAKLVGDLNMGVKAQPVSCGIDLSRFKPQNDGTYLKKRYAVPKNRMVLLYVGRLDKEKRLDNVISALALIVKKADVQLVIAGTGKQRQPLERQAEVLGIRDHITFAGFVPDKDLPNLYRIADVFIIAGIAELQSIVTLEALASGLPVLGVNAVALPELIHHGKNGYLFEDGDIEKMAEYAVKLFSDANLRERMAAESLKIVRKHDINVSLAVYESIYEDVIDRYAKRTKSKLQLAR